MKATTSKPAPKAIIHPTHSGIRIQTITNRLNGQAYGESFLVTVPGKVTGNGRKRKQFDELDKAKNWASNQFKGSRQLGQAFHILDETEQRKAVEAIKRLRAHGLDIDEVVEFAIKRMRPEGGDATVQTVVDEILASREARAKTKQLRPESVRTFAIRAKRFAVDFGSRLIKEIGVKEIKDWIMDLECSTRSNRNYFDVIGEVFKVAKQRKYVADSPLQELSDDDKRELCGSMIAGAEAPAILAPEEAQRLLDGALTHSDLDLLAPITLALFCGIRTEELTKLRWEHVKMDAAEPYVAIPAAIAKKRRIRHVPIPTNALAWLLCCKDRKGPITRQDFVTDFRKRFQRLLKAAGFVEKDKEGKVVRIVWKRNSMRHSFGTYHYALDGDSLLTSRLLGHRTGDEVLFAHYRDLATKATAQKYFAIMPTNKPGDIIPMPEAKSA